MRLIVALAVLLPACGALPDRVLGAWDRIFTNGQPIPAGTVDRLTATQDGHVTLERAGRTEHGTWSEDSNSQVTMVLDGVTTTWSASRPQCPDGTWICIRLRNATEDDWYRSALADY